MARDFWRELVERQGVSPSQVVHWRALDSAGISPRFGDILETSARGLIAQRRAERVFRFFRQLDPTVATWDSDFMTRATEKLLEEFEALPDPERSELVSELARRVALLPHELPDDADLVASADLLFTELDRREQPE